MRGKNLIIVTVLFLCLSVIFAATSDVSNTDDSRDVVLDKVLINETIISSDLENVVYDWNGTNYSMMGESQDGSLEKVDGYAYIDGQEDVISPGWSGNKTNFTGLSEVGDIVYFNITLSDPNPDKYCFSWFNGTVWFNSTSLSYSDGEELSVKKVLNLNVGIYRWIWFFNDTFGNSNQSLMWSVELGRAEEANIGLSYLSDDVAGDDLLSADPGENLLEKNVTALSVLADNLIYGSIQESVFPVLDFTGQTPADGFSQSNRYVEINATITEENLDKLIYNWNGTNYTIYNDSLILMYNFDNVSDLNENDTSVVDLSNSGNDGIAVNATWNSTGKYGGSYEFDGLKDYILVADDNSLDIVSGFSVAAWVYRNVDQGQSWQAILTKGEVGDPRNYWFGIGTADDKVYMMFDTSMEPPSIGSNSIIPLNGWHHILFTYNGTVYKLYLDGILDNNVSGVTGTPSVSAVDLIIGAERDEGNGIYEYFFSGKIDEIRFWNRSLSKEEVYVDYISNLNKINSTDWNLYVNQFKNATDVLDYGTYSYQLFVTDSFNNMNSTEQRFVIVQSDLVNLIIDFVGQTPANGSTQTERYVEINATIIEENLDELTYNWNGTNYIIYNDSLILMYNFDNVSVLSENDTYAKELSSFDRDNQVFGASYVLGKNQNGLYFDGSNHINVSGSYPTGTQPRSLCLWIKHETGTSSGNSDHVINYGTYDTNKGFGIMLYSNTWQFFGFGEGSDINTNVLGDTNWHHHCITYNSTNVNYYIDTIIYGNEERTLETTGSNFVIGANPIIDSNNFFNGIVDEIRFWNRSLSKEEVYVDYISNLNKINSTDWNLYVNQSKNATDVLDLGTYSYQVFGKDDNDQENSSEERTIIIDVEPDVMIGLEILVPENFIQGINVSQYGWFNVTLNVSCLSDDCGEINVSLDPVSSEIYNFTNCGVSGISGPSQEDCNTEYSGTTLDSSVSVDSGIQNWTVPETGNYAITLAGASGGDTARASGGNGRIIYANLSLTQGDVLKILVGQEGGYINFVDGKAGGGGGGTFIVYNNDTPILIAGGGGGAGDAFSGNYNEAVGGSDAASYDSTSGTYGVSSSVSWDSPQAGGTAGSGGDADQGSAGGGGYLGNGETGHYAGNPGIAYLNGGSGGINVDKSGGIAISNIPGGFGGGSGAGIYSSYECNAGAGGGYSGGGGSDTRVSGGGGGGNYIASYIENYADGGLNDGDGFVMIEFIPLVKNGLILTTEGANPFYTNASSNPLNITLAEGESQIVTFYVNATAAIENTYEFFCYANMTTNMSVSNRTSVWNVTIIDDTDPSYINAGTNLSSYSLQGDRIRFNITADEKNPDKYIFSWFNGSSWENTIPASYSDGEVLSVDKTLNINGGTINWTWYFNDTAGNLNQSEVWSISLIEPFKFKITTTESPENFSFQTDGAVNLVVNWGDGNSDTYDGTGLRSHEYATAGDYNVSLRGQVGRISFWEGTEDLLQDILTPMSNSLTGINSSARMFNGASSIVTFTAEDFFDDMSGNVKDMSRMFFQATNFNSNISNWDVSNVTDMSYMFYGASSFDQDIGIWNVSNVIDMNGMFYSCPFNQNIGDWDVSSVTNMYSMFYMTSDFNQNLSSWDVSNVNNMGSMFESAFKFNGNISNWNVSNVTNMNSMFKNAFVFNQNINGWDVSSVIDMEDMFYQAKIFNEAIGAWNVSSVTDMSRMFNHAFDFNQDIGSWDMSNVQDISGMFSYAADFNQDIGNWDVSNVENMGALFSSDAIFNQNLSCWDVSSATNMDYMFSAAHAFNQNISGWDVSNVTTMKGMFMNALIFNQNISCWNVSGVTNMNSMFYHAKKFDQNLSSWDISNVTDMTSMLDDSNISTSNYDSLLIGWNSFPLLQNDVSFDAGTNTKYNPGAAATARQNIIDTYNWTITDGGILPDTTDPDVTLIVPSNEYFNDISDPVNVSFNCSAMDDRGLSNISLYITDNENTSFSLNQTTNISGTSNSSSWTLSLENGNYTWNCLVYDLAGNVAWGENRSFELAYSEDMVNPGISFNPDTPDNDTNSINASFIVNVSIIDNTLDNVKYLWNGTNYTMMDDSLILFFNFDNASLVGDEVNLTYDLSGYENHGNFINQSQWNLSGRYGYGVSMDGSNGYVRVNDSESLNITDEITVEIWVNDPPRIYIDFCGGSVKSTFVPDGFTGRENCDPDSQTYSVFVTRSGYSFLTTTELKSVLDNGGNVITEYSASDDIYNKVFDDSVSLGSRYGNCGDIIAFNHQYNPSDKFWTRNSHTWTYYSGYSGSTGCGYDMSGWGNVVALSGWDDSTVQVAYRAYGSGYVIFVEADWNDGESVEDDMTSEWMNFAATLQANSPTLIGKGMDAYEVQLDSNQNLIAAVNGHEISTQIEKRWTHVVLTYDGSDQKLYVDGVLAANTSHSGAINKSAQDLIIGKNIAGRIDEIRIWNMSRSADEIYIDYVSSLRKIGNNSWELFVNQSGNSTSGLSYGRYWYGVYATDAFERINQTGLRNILIHEGVFPQISSVNDQIIDWGESFSYSINASDSSGIDCFSVNDSRFSIDCNGNLTNSTGFGPGSYSLLITVNDTYNNLNTTVFNLLVTNLTPCLNFTDMTIDNGNHSIDMFTAGIEASDATLDTVSIFIYNESGLIFSNSSDESQLNTVVSGLSEGYYYLNATANDSVGNTNVSQTRIIRIINPITIEVLEPLSDIEVGLNDTFDIVVNLSCRDDFDCGIINLSLDPISGQEASDEINEMINDEYSNLMGLEKDGLVSTDPSATPFYTEAESNPLPVDLSVNKSEIVTFRVNATGQVNTTHLFFLYANKSSEMTVGSISNRWNVTIINNTEWLVNFTDETTYNDTVWVSNGIYHVNHSIKLVNDIYNTSNDLIRIEIDDMYIDCNGATLIGDNGTGDIGIEVNGHQNVTIKNCNIMHFAHAIKYRNNASGNILSNNISKNVYASVRIDTGSRVDVLNNSFINCYRGIRMYYAGNNSISRNVFVGNKVDGINLNPDCSYVNITENNFTSNRMGVVISVNSSNNTIWSNIFELSDSWALTVSKSQGNSVYNNLFNNSRNVNTDSVYSTVWNTSYSNMSSIIGRDAYGGNVYTNPTNSGSSDKCIDADNDGICDSAMKIRNSMNYDYLALAMLDLENPSLDVGNPENDSYVNGNVRIYATAKDNNAVKNVLFEIKNLTEEYSVLCNDTIKNYRCLWRTRDYDDPASGYYIRVTAIDYSGNNASMVMHYTIDRDLPYVEDVNVTYPDGQEYVRNGQQILLRVNVSDSEYVGAGMNITKVNISSLDPGFTSLQEMSLQTGSSSLLTGNWSIWLMNVTANTTSGDKYAKIYAYDNAFPSKNLRRSEKFYVFVDSSAPGYTNMLNTNSYDNEEITFKIDCSDDNELDRIILSTNISGEWVNESAEELSYDTASVSMDKQKMTGNFSYRWYVFDVVGNVNVTEIVTVPAWGTRPAFAVNSLFPVDMNKTEENMVNFTFMYNHGTALNCSLYIDSVLNDTVTSPENGSVINFEKALVDGKYSWHATCLDNASMMEVESSIRELTLDSTVPEIVLNYPGTGYYDGAVENISYTIIEANVLDCFYSINDAENITIPLCQNLTGLGIGAGDYNLTVYISDVMGRIISDTAGFSIDTTAPAIVFGRHTTSNSNLSQSFIRAMVMADDWNLDIVIASLYNSTGLVVSHNSTDDFIYTFENLADGIYYLNATAIDLAGNMNSTATRIIDLDTTSPVIGLLCPDEGYNSSIGEVGFIFNASDRNLESCSLFIDTPGYMNYQLIDSNESVFSGAATTLNATGLHNRTNSWYINCSDSAGNFGISSVRNLTVDMVPPSVVITTPIEDDILGYLVYVYTEVTDSLSDVDKVIYEMLNSTDSSQILGQGELNESGNWDGIWNSSYYSDAEWNVTFMIKANDTLGNEYSTNYSFLLDNVNPSVQFLRPAKDMEYFDSDFNMSVIVQDLTLNYSNYTVSGQYNSTEGLSALFTWNDSINLSGLSDGEYNLSVYARDSVLNERFSTAVFVKDFTAPSVTLNFPTENLRTNETALEFNWTAIDNIATIMDCNLSIGGVVVKSDISCSNGTYCTYTVNGLVWSDYDWNVSCVDFAGNVNGEGSSFIPDWNDEDGDEVHNNEDRLIGDEDDVQQNGTVGIDITVGGEENLTTFTDEKEVVFFEEDEPIINFTHNFTEEKLDLSKISIVADDDSIIVNLSDQLLAGKKKTLRIRDNSFVSLCVKDAEIASISEVSSGCNESFEMDFTDCLGNSTGVVIDGITCVDEGRMIRVENLTHSAIKGQIRDEAVVVDEESSDLSGRSGSSRSYVVDGTEDIIDHGSGKAELALYDELVIEHENKTYKLFLYEIDYENHSVILKYEENEILVEMNELTLFDLDQDGAVDIELSLILIDKPNVQIAFSKHVESIIKDDDISSDDGKEIVISKDDDDKEDNLADQILDEEGKPFSYYLGIGIAVFMFIVFIVFFMRRNKEDDKNAEENRISENKSDLGMKTDVEDYGTYAYPSVDVFDEKTGLPTQRNLDNSHVSNGIDENMEVDPKV